jgi:myo-inositol-1(or 4)-monophosphatase
MSIRLAEITQEVIKISKQAGAFIRQERTHFDPNAIEFKDHSSNLVSYVDKETEKLLVKLLSALLPEAGFITEEGTVPQYDKQEWCWIIDPLDGTTNFLHNIPIYCVSIGLMQNNAMALGVVYDICRDECFYAWKNGGAYCNDKQISVSKPENLGGCLLATGFPYYTFEKFDNYLEILKELIRNSHGLRRCGSAAIDMSWVAAGRFDGYFEYNINAYDIAAGCIILTEAGGVITDFKGEQDYLFGRNIVAAAQTVQEEMLSIVKKNWN